MGWSSYIIPRTRTFQSEINGKITLVEFLWIKNLFSGGVTQSGGFSLKMWDRALKKLKLRNLKIQKCLVLGVGGGTAIKTVSRYFPDADITGVEIDPVMVNIARKYFSIPDNTKIITADVFKWIRKENPARYDLIITDLYIGKLNPDGVHKDGFLNLLKKLIGNNGVILFNSHYQKEEDFKSFTERAEKIFRRADIIDSYLLSRLILLE